MIYVMILKVWIRFIVKFIYYCKLLFMNVVYIFVLVFIYFLLMNSMKNGFWYSLKFYWFN